MQYSCDIIDEAINVKSKRNNLQCLTNNEFDKCIRRKHIIQKPDFFDVDSIFDEQITNDTKKVESNLAKFDSNLVFIVSEKHFAEKVINKEFTPHIESELERNLTEFNSKRLLIARIQFFIQRR